MASKTTTTTTKQTSTTTTTTITPTAIPESVLKKRKTLQVLAAKRAERAAAAKKKQVSRTKLSFKRAEKYIKEYKAAENEQIRLKRAAKAAGNIYVSPEPKVALVVRIRGIVGIAPKARKILQLLRLRQIHNAVRTSTFFFSLS
jgi:large subunit ribosomal protein L7e